MFDLTVFAALGWEARLVTQALSGMEPGDRPGTWRGYLGDGASCVVVRTGVGPDRAAAAAESAPPSRMFLCAGCAGGLGAGLRAGDLVAATSVVCFDRKAAPGERLAIDCTALAAFGAARGLHIAAGPIASSPVVLATAASKAAMSASGALVVEMESASIALAARRRGIPFLGLRVVLDESGEPLPVDALVLDANGEVRPLPTLMALTVRPRTWLSIARLARQRRVAERRLGSCLAVLLGGGLDALGLPPAAARVAAG